MNTRIHSVPTQALYSSLFLGLFLTTAAQATTLGTSTVLTQTVQPGAMRSIRLASMLQPIASPARSNLCCETIGGPNLTQPMSLLEQLELAFERARSQRAPIADETIRVDDSPVLDLAMAQGAPLHKVVLSTGAIEADVTAFRALLGNPNNNAVPGQQLTGHREINWDAVPAAVTNVPTFPVNFFNSNSPRGLVYQLASGGLQVSNQSYVDINPDYADEFHPFSGGKVFSPVGRNDTEASFFVAGSNTPAAVRGFGVVFVDVDVAGSSGFELFDANGASLGSFTAPVRTDRRGASFVGVVFRNPVIASVRIITGDAALAPGVSDVTHGGQHDLAVMDDLIYGEPTAP